VTESLEEGATRRLSGTANDLTSEKPALSTLEFPKGDNPKEIVEVQLGVSRILGYLASASECPSATYI
jgi:hypothetical protein